MRTDKKLRTLDVTRYLVPLREGGSLPAIVEGDDGLLYVLKFRGAGQGKKALIAEIIGGEIARSIGLYIPEMTLMHLDKSFGMTEPDEEIQDLLKFSVGTNLGFYFLSQSITYDPLVSDIDGYLASKIVLLDSIITNVDRTAKNTNLLIWNNELWLIDHGASLYFHHNWKNWEEHSKRTFPSIKDHVLLDKADRLEEASEWIKEQLTEDVLKHIISLIPDDFLDDDSIGISPEDQRKVYYQYINTKINNIDLLTQEAKDAR